MPKSELELNISPKIDLEKDVVILDGEISDEITDNSQLGKSWELHPSVFCTLTASHGYRDWIGDSSIPALVNYLTRFKRIIGFNLLRFDLGLIDGSLMRGFDAGAKATRQVIGSVIDLSERDPAPGMMATLFRTKVIDLHLDIQAYLDGLKHPRQGRLHQAPCHA